jgi:predicted RNA-binding Zn ribbon-like protein
VSSESGGFACLDFVHRTDLAAVTLSPAAQSTVEKFRITLGRLLTDEARGRGASERDLRELDRFLARASADRGLVPTVRGYGWGWLRPPDPLVERLFPAAWSAATLLTGPDRHRLKCCDGCDRLFVDQSRNRSRRWCDMQRCGNRDKVRRFRACASTPESAA